MFSTDETISYTEARGRLAELLDRVESTRDHIVIISRRGHANVAIINADELSSLLETAHLVRSPANARRLAQALQEVASGAAKKMTLAQLKKQAGAT
jgi:antitoxin YefM